MQISELLCGRVDGEEKYIEGFSSSHFILIYAQGKAFESIVKDLKADFKLINVDDCYTQSEIDILDSIDRKLAMILKNSQRINLTECKDCKVPAVGAFCHLCGKQIETKLKICYDCNQVYAPSYVYCQNCGKELSISTKFYYDYEDPEDFLYGVDLEKTDIADEKD